MKRRFGDRYDGFRLRNIPAFTTIVPHLMVERSDAQVMGELEIDAEPAEAFMKKQRQEGHSVGFMDIFIAALVRTLAVYPAANRFVVGRKLFARKEILISFVAKKDMKVEGENTVLKIAFPPDATLHETAAKLHDEIEFIKRQETSNDTSGFARFLTHFPTWLLAFFIGILKLLDKIGLMPNPVIRLSPFHTSVFVTNFGSLGFPPIYHHIYNFGTTTAFFAIGKYNTVRTENEDGSVERRRTINVMYVADERVSDGYEMSVALKFFLSLLKHPERLLEKPVDLKPDRGL